MRIIVLMLMIMGFLIPGAVFAAKEGGGPNMPDFLFYKARADGGIQTKITTNIHVPAHCPPGVICTRQGQGPVMPNFLRAKKFIRVDMKQMACTKAVGCIKTGMMTARDRTLQKATSYKVVLTPDDKSIQSVCHPASRCHPVTAQEQTSIPNFISNAQMFQPID